MNLQKNNYLDVKTLIVTKNVIATYIIRLQGF